MKLFCPGPVMVSNNVKQAMVDTTMGHRGVEFESMFKRLKENIIELVKATNEFEAVILSSSGSSANEAVIASLFNTNDKVLILSNGSFGERIASMFKSYKLNYDIIKNEWGQTFDLDEIENELKSNNYQYVFISHDETSSGLLNPIEEIGTLCKRYNSYFFVDCVSSVASDEVDMVKQNISILTAVSGKAIGAVPGASFIVMKEELFEKTLTNDVTSFYLNLATYYKFSKEKNQTPNTPNITNFIALDVALKECLEENKAIRYKQCSDYIRDELENMKLDFIIDRSLMSNTVTTVKLPEHFSAKEIYSKLYDAGYTTYLTRGIFSELNCIQICVMGEIYLEDCKEFIDTFKQIIK